jgi:hypothetical protein
MQKVVSPGGQFFKFYLFSKANFRYSIKLKKAFQALLHLSAEKEGFEPPDLLQSTVFKTAALDRSAISPPQKYYFFQIGKAFLIFF